jgi:hypothetical protein
LQLVPFAPDPVELLALRAQPGVGPRRRGLLRAERRGGAREGGGER